MNLTDNLYQIKQLIQHTEIKPNSVLLVAVSKQQSIETIQQAFNLGVHHFGESYFQEAHTKIIALSDLPIYWHFIGPIQSNKTSGIAHSFSWVHSINRLKIAQMLHQHRPNYLPPLNVCLHINLIDEATKSGITQEEAFGLALEVSQLTHLKLRGLMTLPPPQMNEHQQYELFLHLNQLMHAMNQQLGLAMDTLSMGMSSDLVPAIKAGATIVRIGTAIFGERQN